MARLCGCCGSCARLSRCPRVPATPVRGRGGTTEHPAANMTLEKGHALGKEGFARLLPVGSEFHYGPCYENMEVHVRVIETPKQQGGLRPLRDHNLAVWRTLKSGRRECIKEGPRTWFVKCVIISSPFAPSGSEVSLPPCALIPRTAVEWERDLFGLKPGEAPTPQELAVIRMRAEATTLPTWWTVNAERATACLPPYCQADIDFCAEMHCDETMIAALEKENARLRSMNGTLKGQVTRLIARRREAEDKLRKVREAAR